MWSLLCNIYDKFFPKATVGQKRKLEEWTEYPPVKQMKLDSRCNFDTEPSSYNFVSKMKKGENIYEEEDDECCKTNTVFHRKWGPTPAMARQSIHRPMYSLGSSVALDKRKLESNSNSHVSKQPVCQSSMLDDIAVVKYVNKNSTASSGKQVIKNKSPTSRLFNSYRTSSSRQNGDKFRSSSQNSMKKTLNFLQESYRLSEKLQYMQLLQQQTMKLNSLLAPFTIQPVGSQKGKKSCIPLIDLTKEKNNVIVDRSRENIPWTSSKTKSAENIECIDLDTEKKEVKVNTLQDILKTHPVTDRHIIEEILSRHSSETAKKRREAEIEAAKLKILSATNRKAYSDALEEKLKQYMRITTPAVEEIEPEKEKYVLPELTKEQEGKVSAALVPSPASEVLVEKFGLQIKRRDLQTLKGLNWLNDEVINFYMNLIMERGKDDKLPNVYAFNTFFYPKLTSGGHSSLKRWTKKVDIFAHDMILVPIHLGMHWCMAVIDFRSKQVKYYDSMGSPNNRCLEALLSYLEAESLDKKKVPYSTNDWEQINVEDIPQQMNGSDCGVFSCMFAEHLARDAPLLFSQDNMPYFRRKMALEIIEARLLTYMKQKETTYRKPVNLDAALSDKVPSAARIFNGIGEKVMCTIVGKDAMVDRFGGKRDVRNSRWVLRDLLILELIDCNCDRIDLSKTKNTTEEK